MGIKHFKHISILLLIVIFHPKLFAQNSPELSKYETVAYLDKKIKEVLNHYRTTKTDNGKIIRFYYYDNEISIDYDSDNIKVGTIRSEYSPLPKGIYFDYFSLRTYGNYRFPCDFYYARTVFNFNPSFISKIEIDESSIPTDPVGLIKITLTSKVCTKNFYSHGADYNYADNNYECGSWLVGEDETTLEDIVYMAFLQTDPSNFNKIKKALEHLKKLYTEEAEKDPFAD